MRTIRRASPSLGTRVRAVLLAGGFCGLGVPAHADPLADGALERPPTIAISGPEDEAAAPMQLAGPALAGTAPSMAWPVAAPAGWGEAVGYGGTAGTGADAGRGGPAAIEEEEEDDDPALWAPSAFGNRSRPGGCVNGALHISVCGPDMQAWQQSAEFALKDVWRRIAGQAPTIRTALRNAPAKARPALTRDGWRLRVNRRVLMLNWQVRF